LVNNKTVEASEASKRLKTHFLNLADGTGKERKIAAISSEARFAI